jgi:hypothetical protein
MHERALLPASHSGSRGRETPAIRVPSIPIRLAYKRTGTGGTHGPLRDNVPDNRNERKSAGAWRLERHSDTPTAGANVPDSDASRNSKIWQALECRPFQEQSPSTRLRIRRYRQVGEALSGCRPTGRSRSHSIARIEEPLRRHLLQCNWRPRVRIGTMSQASSWLRGQINMEMGLS